MVERRALPGAALLAVGACRMPSPRSLFPHKSSDPFALIDASLLTLG